MECSALIKIEINQGDISKKLFQNSRQKNLIKELQQMLFQLGFKKELKWDEFQDDGDFGPATSNAVLAFIKKNGKTGNGTKVNNALAKLMIERHSFLQSMYILFSIHQSDLRKTTFISKGTPTSIRAVQALLVQMGYSKELSLSKFGIDGKYGASTQKAFIKYAKDNGIESSDGDTLTRPIINLMLKDISAFYGDSWSELAQNGLPNGKSPLILFEGSRFRGKPCMADVQFKPLLERINTYAEEADVFLKVTSSFRTTSNVKGAIVTPAKTSNHMAGHGIDMNVIYGNNKLANSTVLRKYPNVPKPVKQFLKSIIDDNDLRWGGKFRSKDPVHIDDHLNKDLNKWKKRYRAMQRAVQLGK